ncbi:unnamed protein product [Echinostoma caproni]|uniref:Phospholipid-transporting ATPase n=1 Tax=Echinostoma caproni TaxID=27848 RepID=A0A183A616_9TREM|nr:unnamed protein product [Echinostoma caproni]
MPKSSCVCSCRRKRREKETRIVYANHGPEYLIPEADRKVKFCNNAIISSRYTWYNFVPKNLFEQFHNMANVFFAMISILYVFASPTTSIWSNLGPLMAILAIIMVKDGVEDILRHRRDRALNHIPVNVLEVNWTDETVKWTQKKAMNLSVGDVIKCDRGKAFPCDIVLLASSNTTTEVNVTTANLDGESNIKKYFAVGETQTIYHQVANPDWLAGPNGALFSQLAKQLHVKVECQPPCADLTRFEGRMSSTLWDTEEPIPLTFPNLALRGAKLANTEFVLGLVVYTGKDTKLSLNGKQAKRKYSSREARSNIILLSFIIAMIVISIIFGIVYTVWTSQNKANMWYLSNAPQTSWEFVQNVFRFIVIVNYLIPISIIFIIEFQQMYIAFTISSDLQMHDPVEDQASKANSAQVADELGQVEFLFSDKTGTLTQNVMQLRTCAVLHQNGTADVYEFAHAQSEYSSIDGTRSPSRGRHSGATERESVFSSSSSSENEDDNDDARYEGKRDSRSGGNGSSSTSKESFRLNARAPKRNYLKPVVEPNGTLEYILTLFTLCHTVELDENQEEGQVMPKYEAASPDEKALVEGAAEHGVIFLQSKPIEGQVNSKTYRIEYQRTDDLDHAPPGHSNSTGSAKTIEYIVDAVLEFDSTRKRMTVMTRYPDGTCHIHSKGAETSMLDAESCAESCGAIRTKAMHYVNEFALDGLRTLVYGTRQVDRAEYDRLLTELRRTRGLVGEQRLRAMREVYQAIESNLVPCAVTGVEDKLQVGVRECLQSLRESGIQIWILTGDKEETAVTVSQSAGHFTPQMSLIRLTNCPDFHTAACWLFEQIEGLQTRFDLRLTRRTHTQTTLVPQSTSRRSLITPSIEEVGEVVLAAAECEENATGSEDKGSETKRRRLTRRLLSFVRGGTWKKLRLPRRRHTHRPGLAGEPIGLVIDGKTLNCVLHPTLRDAFLDLCMNVTTVLCCRMTPLQKASIVQLVQAGLARSSSGEGSTPVTAAVGDGGNDVAMLLQANIGVGLYGKEGREAARAGDYSLPGFRYLHRLFLLHGHWAYHRLTFTMNLFYFKCTALVTTELLLQFYSGFSQIANYGGILFALFNLTMTSVACLLYGMFEQHLPERELMLRPYLYRVISRQANLRAWFVILWIVEGLWFALITFFIVVCGLAGGMYYAPAIFMEPGVPPRAMYDFSLVGVANYVCIWIAVNVRIAILTRHMNYMMVIGFLITLVNIGILFLYQTTCGYESLEYLAFVKLARSPAFWFSLMLSVFIANFSSIIWRMASDTWWTSQIRLSEIPQRKMRKKRRRSPRFWFESLVDGQRDYRPMGNN